MADRESSRVGFRIRGIEPYDLSRYPDAVKLMWWGWVLEFGLQAKDKDLARGLDKDGEPLAPLSPEAIKHRKSEVGPTFRNAPPLEPSYGRSRVRSLLTGRAHLQSAEFFWRFDSHTGKSFAVILNYQAEEYGRDVFGLSPQGTAWTRSKALAKWEAWKAKQHVGLPLVSVPGRQVAAMKQTVKTPLRKIPLVGRTDLENMTLMGDEAQIQRAIKAGQFTGFRRLNARGEKWTPPRPSLSAPAPLIRLAPGTVKRVPKIDLAVMGNPSAESIQAVREAIDQLPAAIHKALKKAQIKFVFARRLEDFDAVLAFTQPRGWPEGTTFAHVEGGFHEELKRIIVAQERLGKAGYETSTRMIAVVQHETGHALDVALGDLTQSDRFAQAYEADVAALTETQRGVLGYFLQPGVPGKEETFAEVVAQILGRGTGGPQLLNVFPRVAAMVRGLLK